MANIEKIIANTFLEMAQGLETGSFGRRPKIALTGMGSEHGEVNSIAAAKMAADRGVDVYYIGTLEAPGVTTVHVANEDEGHKKMDEMLSSGEVDGAVTMHYPFPIGVSTVGRVITPAKGKQMFVANTTGTSSTDRIEGMIKNAIYGIITAKASGIKDPTVGILNVDGARQTEMALNQLKEGGYQFSWATSARADGGAVLRGNDVLQGTPDVLVCDSLTGNVLIKMLSAYSTGGSFEATGYGYGPGIGKGYHKLIHIISRASGAPLIANALVYAADMVRGKVFEVADKEFAAAEKAGLDKILAAIEHIDGEGGGGTNFSPALKRAGMALAALTDVENKHIIFITDGEPSAGDAENYKYWLQENAKNGITTSVIGVRCTNTAKNTMKILLTNYAGMTEDNFHDVTDLNSASSTIKKGESQVKATLKTILDKLDELAQTEFGI